jgi:alkanesulfonate monooxygenase SsuD/methylene tetrahydromethanopterin reductase-like flavin-dependent oxidoreductase (luciferase family)
MAGTQPSSAQLAAERGLGFLHFTFGDPESLDVKVQTYREGLESSEPVGSFVNNQFAAFTLMHCGANDSQALEEGAPGAEWYVRATNMLYSIWASAGSQSYAWYADQFEKGRAGMEVDVSRMSDDGILCIGGPDKCEQISRGFADQGVDQLIFLVQAGGTKHEDIMSSLRRFGEHVIPKFR